MSVRRRWLAAVSLLIAVGCSSSDNSTDAVAGTEPIDAVTTTTPTLTGTGASPATGAPAADGRSASGANAIVEPADSPEAVEDRPEVGSAGASSAVDGSVDPGESPNPSPPESNDEAPSVGSIGDGASGDRSAPTAVPVPVNPSSTIAAPTTTLAPTGDVLASTTTAPSAPASTTQPNPPSEDEAPPPAADDLVVATRVGASIGYPLDLVERIENGVTTQVCIVELPRQLHDEQVQPLPFDRVGTPLGDLIDIADDAILVHLDLVRACDSYPGSQWEAAKADLLALRADALAAAQRAGVEESFLDGMDL